MADKVIIGANTCPGYLRDLLFEAVFSMDRIEAKILLEKIVNEYTDQRIDAKEILDTLSVRYPTKAVFKTQIDNEPPVEYVLKFTKEP